jgi:hypothetical protein
MKISNEQLRIKLLRREYERAESREINARYRMDKAETELQACSQETRKALNKYMAALEMCAATVRKS